MRTFSGSYQKRHYGGHQQQFGGQQQQFGGQQQQFGGQQPHYGGQRSQYGGQPQFRNRRNTDMDKPWVTQVRISILFSSL